MTTEEILKEMKPLTLELDYAEEIEAREAAATEQRASGPADADEFTLTETEEAAEHRTKKEQILSLYESGTRDIAEIGPQGEGAAGRGRRQTSTARRRSRFSRSTSRARATSRRSCGR